MQWCIHISETKQIFLNTFELKFYQEGKERKDDLFPMEISK